jgi:hypothetical protein
MLMIEKKITIATLDFIFVYFCKPLLSITYNYLLGRPNAARRRGLQAVDRYLSRARWQELLIVPSLFTSLRRAVDRRAGWHVEGPLWS